MEPAPHSGGATHSGAATHSGSARLPAHGHASSRSRCMRAHSMMPLASEQERQGACSIRACRMHAHTQASTYSMDATGVWTIVVTSWWRG